MLVNEVPSQTSASVAAGDAEPNSHSLAPAPSDGKGSRLRSIVRVAKWLAAAVVIALVVGIALAAWPQLRDRVRKVDNTSTSLAATRSQLTDVDNRVFAITSDGGPISELDTRLAAVEKLQATLTSRVDELAKVSADHTGQLGRIDALIVQLSDASAVNQADVNRRLAILKSTELMSRARVFLFQANYGLAKQDALAARESLTGVSTQDVAVTSAIARLDAFAARVETRPVLASLDLDAAWQVLLNEVVPAVPVEPVLEVTPTSIVTPTSGPVAASTLANVPTT